MFAADFLLTIAYHIFIPYTGIRKRFVKLNDKEIAVVGSDAAAVACGISHNSVFLWKNLNPRSTVEGIDYHVRIISFRECETEICATVGRSDFRSDVIFRQIHFIIIGMSFLGLMREPARAVFVADFETSAHRHKRHLTEVVDPWARTMRLFEAADFIASVGVRPPVAVASGLRYPLVHSPRKSN